VTTSDTTRIDNPGGHHLVLRAAVAVARTDAGLAIADLRGVRTVVPPWSVWRYALSPNGTYLMAIDDQGRRGQIWSTANAIPLLELVGGSEHRHCLRSGVAEIGARGYALTDATRGALSVFEFERGERVAWLNLSGLTTFEVDRVIQLEPGWIALHGNRYAEQYYTVAIVPIEEVFTDPEVLQSVLLARPSPWWWGYQVAIGPATPGQAVIARNPEWEEGDPEWKDEDLRGFLFWDLARQQVVGRLPWDGAIPNGGTIGADPDRIAIERAGAIDVIDRKSGESRTVPGSALDPYRLTIARRDGGSVVIEPLA